MAPTIEIKKVALIRLEIENIIEILYKHSPSKNHNIKTIIANITNIYLIIIIIIDWLKIKMIIRSNKLNIAYIIKYDILKDLYKQGNHNPPILPPNFR